MSQRLPASPPKPAVSAFWQIPPKENVIKPVIFSAELSCLLQRRARAEELLLMTLTAPRSAAGFICRSLSAVLGAPSFIIWW